MVRIFLNGPQWSACLRVVRTLAAETHEDWTETMQYLNMEPLKAQKAEGTEKEAL